MKIIIFIISCCLISCSTLRIDDGYLGKSSRNFTIKKLESCNKCVDNVKILNLTNYNLSKFPTEILKLTNLEVLDLSNNNIKTLPNSIDKLVNLKKLNLRGTLVKELPNSINKLINLEYILIIDNSLTETEIIKMENIIPDNCKLYYSKEMRMNY